MLLPLLHSHSSLPPKTLTTKSHSPYQTSHFFFSKTLISPKLPKSPKFLIHNSSDSTITTSETLPKSAIQRIADKLRSLGYVEDNPEPTPNHGEPGSVGEIFVPLPNHLPKHRVGHTIDVSWSTPENPVPRPGSGVAIERARDLRIVVEEEKRVARSKEKEERVPCLAELSLKDEELRRLRSIGMKIRKSLKVGKAGITEGIVNGIHERWRRVEVVKIACEDLCKMNMKRTHDTLERKTGGLVVWRSGSSIILYRGDNYKFPYFLSGEGSTNDSSDCNEESYSSDGDNAKSATPNVGNKLVQSPFIKGVGNPNRVRFELPGETLLSAEADHLLDGLGPRFTDWWGYDPLPVDADLLPAIVTGYRRPFRLLPYGVGPTLTNDEMTILRRLSKPLPCHFALGRNRNLQGLAAAMVKLWEKCEIAKVAIKRGMQNTNSEMMAEELKRLTGGNLLSRDREYIVFYRGKDFLPPALSAAIEERRKYGLYGQTHRTTGNAPAVATEDSHPETIQHASEDGLDLTVNHKQNFITEQKKLRSTEVAIKKTSTNLSMVLEKKARAEELLVELEKAEIPQQPEIDKEGITQEERFMLRKVGLRMKPFLLLGRRGVFDGTVENMHLHWKYRELVKIISNERRPEDIHGIARTLEAESGGILVAVERVNKGHAIIVYRGKNYERPASLRPNTLLNKKEAMKRSLEAQRRESLKLHILKLTRNINDLKLQMAKDKETDTMQPAENSNVLLGKQTLGAGSNFKNLNKEINVSVDGHQFVQQDKRIGSYSIDKDDSNLAKPETSSKIETKEVGVVMDLRNEHGNVDSTSRPDISLVQGKKTSLANEKESTVQSPLKYVEVSSQSVVESELVPDSPAPLTNRERLLLRREALKTKKRPVLAIGKSNIVTGVAKAIKTHFQKHQLAIVNVKGRAKGTSVQEVIFKLEQATGAVLVSQEPSKVILYRGWGSGEEPAHRRNNNTKEPSGGFQPPLSPELIAAIKFECGLQSNL